MSENRNKPRLKWMFPGWWACWDNDRWDSYMAFGDTPLLAYMNWKHRA